MKNTELVGALRWYFKTTNCSMDRQNLDENTQYARLLGALIQSLDPSVVCNVHHYNRCGKTCDRCH